MNEIPLERMMGEGVVRRLDKSVNEEISVDDLTAAKPAIEHDDIVAIDTGWSARWGTPEWNQHPYLSMEAAQWLIEHRVKLVAGDTATRDFPFALRPPSRFRSFRTFGGAPAGRQPEDRTPAVRCFSVVR